MTEVRMYGTWPSEITARTLAASLRLGEPCWDSDGNTLAWLEGRSDRGVIVVQEGEGAIRDLTPADMPVRAFVGYGGGDFTLDRGVAHFVNQADQRIYRQALAGGRPRPVTPAFGAASSPTVSPDGRYVAYVHAYDDVDRIAVVDTEGKAWPAMLAEGADFVMQPAWRPGAPQLAWVEWDHPNMPWDATRLVAGTLDVSGVLPRLAKREVVAGGPSVAVFQPEFSRDGRTLFYVSDETGIGCVYARDMESGETKRVLAAEGDFGAPAWTYGLRRFAVLADGSVAAVENRKGFDRLWVANGGGVRDESALHAGYTTLSGIVAAAAGGRLAAVASGGNVPGRVVVIDTGKGGSPRVVRRSDSETVPAAALSMPEAVSWRGADGEQAHGLYWPPASERYHGTGAPPVVVIVHGGPTSQVQAGWYTYAQFFATRGYAVLAPNYRGSTGYGRAYMEKLRGSWGIYDVEDSRTGVEALAAQGKADASRATIFGGSAGGFTVLQSLIDHPGFYRAAICMFGVSNQFALATDTHKFEARYLDGLLGPLPEAAAVYRERSPLFHAERINDPIALFQGDIDRVVRRAQSDSIVASLRARGVPHEYHVYEGEGHGWRKSETIEHFWTAVERFLRERVLFS